MRLRAIVIVGWTSIFSDLIEFRPRRSLWIVLYRLPRKSVMKQTIFSHKERPLLTHAISKLNPEVFSHPVWVQFSNPAKPVPHETIQDLFREAEALQRDHPGDACQVWLICAVYQNHSGQRTGALASIQKARDLAERSGLSRETLWAIWGACAICVQAENYEQATIHFTHLQAMLHERNEWMLADYIDVLRQFFPLPLTGGGAEFAGSVESQRFECLLSLTYDWLHQWGYPTQPDSPMAVGPRVKDASSQRRNARAFFSAASQQGPWHTLKLMFRGELRLCWMRNDLPQAKGQSSFWNSMLRRLRFYFSGREMDAGTIAAPVQLPGSPTPPEIADFPPLILAPSLGPDKAMESSAGNHTLPETNVVRAMAVHMLGRFVITIQDVELTLAASRSLSLLKYLLFYHKQKIPREVLMDVFWPDASSRTGRNNLNVALHSIRRAVRPATALPMILYKDGTYAIAPDMQVWLDVEEFERLVNAGQRMEARNQLAAVSQYEAAISIYQGDFLPENLYEEWTILERERLRAAYLETLGRLSQIYFSHEHYAACITASRHLLSRDPCREDTHCLLMRCYSRQGQQHLALRQYQVCVEALRLELDVAPAPATTQLFEYIRQHRPV